jgi:hypothetical protein
MTKHKVGSNRLTSAFQTRMFAYRFYLLLFLFLGFPTGMFAQVTTGSVTGIATDTSGAAVPGVTITFAAKSTGVVRSIQTNSEGVFTSPALPPDEYALKAQANGFASEQTEIPISVGKISRWDLVLRPGTTSDTITVTDTPARFDTQSHDLAETVDSNRIESLPSNGRTLFATLTSAAGVQPYTGSGNGGSDTDYFHEGGNSLVIGGSVYGTTGYLQDGVTNFNVLTKTANYQPSIEAAQEVSIVRNGSSARYDSPNIVNVVTKSGTNQFHGRLYDFLRNDALDAIGEIKAAKPPLRYNQFGGNIGGPILRNRLFFFFDYAGLRELDSTILSATVPTGDERNGDFSAISAALYDPQTYNAATGTIGRFTNNMIPGGRITDFAKKFLAYYPLPTLSNVAGTNFQRTANGTSNYDSYLGRVDYAIGPHDAIYGAFMTTTPVTTGPSFAAVPLFNTEYILGGRNAYIQETHSFSPTFTNIARIGYNRSNVFYTQSGAGTTNFAQEFGITALEGMPLQQSAPPTVSITSYSGLGTATIPGGALQNLFQYSDEVTLTRGRHTLYFGAELDRIQFDADWTIYNNGAFGFNGQYTADHTLKQTGGNAVADLLLGLAEHVEGGIGHTTAAFRQFNFMPYFQDDWRLSQRLTLNFGIRYDYYQSPYDKNGHSNVYDIPTNTNHPGTFHQNYDNFAPRFGFAYALRPSTVLRGGYGIYYAIPLYNNFQFLMANAPNYIQQNYTYTATQVVPLLTALVTNPDTSSQAPFTTALIMPTEYVQQRNLSIQQGLGRHITAQLDYIGANSLHLQMRRNGNQAYVPVDPNNPGTLQSRRPYSWVGDVYQVINGASANYNAVEISARGTFAPGTFFSSFVFGKSLDNVTSEEKPPLDGNNLNLDYGLSDFNRKYVFKIGGEVTLPIVGTSGSLIRSNNLLLREVLGGWKASGIVQVDAGLPFYVNTTDNSNTGSYHAARANRICNGNNFAHRSRQEWFDTSCYVQPLVYQLGTEPRNDLIAPRNTSTDASAFKSFGFMESRSITFRVDAFGLLNHPLPSQPNASTAATNNGIITSFGGARTLQASLKVSF